MKYAHYDINTQKLLGWYDDEIHQNIPEPNIAVSEDVWRKAINQNANYVDVENKVVIYKDFRTDTEKFNDLKTFLLSQNNREFNDRVNQLTVSYPEREVLTWDKQEQEARVYLKDNSVSTPLLDNLSISRRIDKDTLAQKIVEKANAYASEVGYLLGKRQRIEDLINSQTTIEELEQIDVKGLWNE